MNVTREFRDSLSDIPDDKRMATIGRAVVEYLYPDRILATHRVTPLLVMAELRRRDKERTLMKELK